MNGFFDRIGFILPGFWDIVQILIVGAVLYYALRVLARTRAIQMLAGLLVLALTYIAARLLGLFLITHLMEKLLEYGAIAALIVFQPELRSGLARLGQSRMVRIFNRLEEREVAEEVVEAVERLVRSKIGGIIVMEREMGLGEYSETGSALKARVSADLIVSLFAPYGPLHDGAVLVQGDTIIAAGVILPLTQYPVTDKSLGTRHRAALGLSEEADALVIVVSEETSQISLAHRGRMERNVSVERLRQALAGAPLKEQRIGA
jgi:diadenylate cyclase